MNTIMMQQPNHHHRLIIVLMIVIVVSSLTQSLAWIQHVVVIPFIILRSQQQRIMRTIITHQPYRSNHILSGQYKRHIVSLHLHNDREIKSRTFMARSDIVKTSNKIADGLEDIETNIPDALIIIEANDTSTGSFLGFQDSDIASKGIVSTITNVVNSLSSRIITFDDKNSNKMNDDNNRSKFPASLSLTSNLSSPPISIDQLMLRLQNDYIINNYLWTGNLDMNLFDINCTFTDPTISFIGTNQYTKNIQNLKPIIKIVVGTEIDQLSTNSDCQSKLLSISHNDSAQYIQTKWNMIGTLRNLIWKPQINIIGQTKFWYRRINDSSINDNGQEEQKEQSDDYYQIYFYDEEWEIPASQALLQLITPGSWIISATNTTTSS